MSRRTEELYDITEAEPDDDGLIECPLLPLRDMVMFPHMVTPLFVGREKSLAAITAAQASGKTLLAVTQINPEVEDPGTEDWYAVGVEVAVGRMLRMPDNSTSVLAQGRRRIQVVAITQAEPYYVAKARIIDEPTGRPRETEALMRAVLALFEKCIQLNRSLPEEAYVFAMNIEEPGWLADLVASTINLEIAERQAVLETFEPTARLQRITAGKLVALLPPGAELWLDGGHNPGAGSVIAEAMADLEDRVSRPLILVVGMLTTKDPVGFLRPFAGLAREAIMVPIPGHAGREPEELAEAARAAGLPAEPAPDVATALRMIGARTLEAPPRILICGSLYLAGLVLEESGVLPR